MLDTQRNTISVIAVSATDKERQASLVVKHRSSMLNLQHQAWTYFPLYQATSMVPTAVPQWLVHMLQALQLLFGQLTPALSNEDVRKILRDTAENLGLSANHQGYGLVRGDLAVAEITPEPTLYTLTVQVDEDKGTVTVVPEHNDNKYEAGTEVTLTAIPKAGYEFESWTIVEEEPITTPSITITMDNDKTVTANFKQSTSSDGTVKVKAITYTTTGGRLNDQHLLITISIVDDTGAAVTGAAVSIEISIKVGENSEPVASPTGTSGTDGTVTFRYNNAPSGTYTTRVTNVVAAGLTWDGDYPDNEFTK
jgi:uncharacterized repeat protein (TIGR02543 family)